MTTAVDRIFTLKSCTETNDMIGHPGNMTYQSWHVIRSREIYWCNFLAKQECLRQRNG